MGIYLRRAAIFDFAIALGSAAMAIQVRFGDHVTPEYAAFSLIFPLLWVLALRFSGAYDDRYIGIGSDEFRRVLNAGVSLTAGLAVLSYAVNAELSGTYLLITMPSVTVLDLIVRWAMRKRLQVARGPPVAERSASSSHSRTICKFCGKRSRDIRGNPEGTTVVVTAHEHDTLDVFKSDIVGLDIAKLVRRAIVGDTRAWEQLIDQYGRLIWSITREFKLAESDAADVYQTTWMRLVERIDRLDYPDRVGSWLAATARNECLRCLGWHKRLVLAPEDVVFDGPAVHEPAVDEALLADERAQIVREAMAHLPQRWRRLLELLMADPPASYAEISDELGLPIGSIGPTRGRCLARLRVLLDPC